ncbi:very short patch repair endonuclease [Agrobacterium sp. S2/73]|uniref:very short patch repair endonuclease n=1 Tax=unclassified Agrobacterium TaxID=2632611 RepID=UPI001ADAC8B0|nr:MULTISPECIES: very short patch repair endonuclease [unclassified Agrobacterium]MBO9107286.1 very short patch repair endonuclease [Agrobacterium sp. S2/73]QXZ72126.1 very short patch repair endonuclease [Agrobacterium sp. S7/73]
MSRVSPSSHEASLRMARVRQKGTDVELSLRKELHARGLRYRLQVPLLTKPRRVADIVFPRAKLAVFVDGCFWHGCPQHASWPKSNAQFWRDKIETNRARDADTDRRLSASGWRVIRVWAHELPGEAAERIESIVRSGSELQ